MFSRTARHNSVILSGLVVLSIVLCGLTSASADVRLHKIFTDNMVLQRDMVVPVWGWAEPGEKVEVRFGDQSSSAVTGKDGKWTTKLDAMKAEPTPADLTVEGENTITLKNIVVGDVWLCSGQSNMQWGLGGCDSPDDIASADFPLIRFVTLPVICSPGPDEDINADRIDWNVCRLDNAGGISGVGFYFARKVHKETGVPIGILVGSVGGTNIEKWMSYESFATEPTLEGMAKDIDRAVAEYRKDLETQLPIIEGWIPKAKVALLQGWRIPDPPDIHRHPSMPGSRAGGHYLHLFNGMISPLVKFPIRGALWYQGENNSEEEDSYTAKMRAMIAGWRSLWGYDFPFYYVQLANWLKPTDVPSGYDDQYKWQMCRMGQLKALGIPKTGMAVIIDVGDAGDIHPRNKMDVGERLALWALAKDYGKTDLVYSGPLYKEMKIEGNEIRISFDSTGGGLMVGSKVGKEPTKEVQNGTLKRFAVAGEDKNWVWADAVIDGTTVLVSSPKVPNPVAVRYAFSINPEGCNLYNKEGLPASPFRTDNW